MTYVNARDAWGSCIRVNVRDGSLLTLRTIDAYQRGAQATGEDEGSGAGTGPSHEQCVHSWGSSIMRANFRIVLATLAVFVAICGIFAAIHGLFFDRDSAVRYGAAAVVIGVAAFVLLLNPLMGLDEDSHPDRWK